MAKAKLYPAQQSNAYLELLECIKAGQVLDESQVGVLKKLEAFFQRGFSRFDLIIVPIFSKKDYAPHFTVLVLDFSASASVGLRLKCETQGAERVCRLRY